MSWKNVAFPTQTGTFTLEFDATPFDSNDDAIAGLSVGAVSNPNGLAANVRFSSWGTILARNGSAYSAANTLLYTVGATYHVRLVVRLSSRRYDIYVTPPSGPEMAVGLDFRFNTPQSSVTSLGNVGIRGEQTGLRICNWTVQPANTPQPQISVSPASIAFGSLLTGASSSQTVTVTNSGTASLSISQAVASGAGFSLAGLSVPLTLVAGQSTSFSVWFAPGAVGIVSGSVLLTSNAPGSPTAIGLSGAGVAPPPPPQPAQLSVSPPSAGFGSVIVGNTNTQMLTLTNTGGSNLTVSAPNISGSGFSSSGLSFPLTLAPGQGANLTVAFAPASAGAASGSLLLASNSPNSPATVTLSGTGIAAIRQLAASPASLTFTGVNVGSSTTQNVTLTNTGNVNVNLSQANVAGAGLSASGFTPSLVLAPSQSTTFGVVFAPTAAGTLNGSVSVTSNATNSPATVSVSGTAVAPPPPPPPSGGAPICGRLDDGINHTPPNYATLAPPLRGQSLTDPQYGCNITRLTDSVAQGLGAAAHHQYSTISAMNRDGSYVSVLLENSNKLIADATGNVVVNSANMPGTNSAQLPWDRASANIFYYSSGNRLMRGTINGANSVSNAVVRTFTNFSSVKIPDQTDLSEDGKKIWLIGNPGSECAGTAIAYNLSTDTILSQSLTLNSCHKVQTFPSGKMLCTECNGMSVAIYNPDGTLNWNVPTWSAHADVGTDLQGREVLIHTANGNAALNACSDRWSSLSVIDINTRQPLNCLVDNIPAWHVSYRSTSGWAVISTFDSSACPSYSCYSLPSNWAGMWPRYGEELLLAKIDGSAVYRLAHHRSRSAQYYWAQSRAAISLDGRYVVFDSNFGVSVPSLSGFSDVYLIRVR